MRFIVWGGLAVVAMLLPACGGGDGEIRQTVVGPTIHCKAKASRAGDVTQPTTVDCGDTTPAPVVVPPVVVAP